MSKKLITGLLAGAAFVGMTLYFTKNKSTKLTKMNQQRQVKNFLKEKFHDNEGILEIVDHLSGEDLDQAFQAIKKLKDDAKKIVVDKKPVKDTLDEFKDQLLDLVK